MKEMIARFGYIESKPAELSKYWPGRSEIVGKMYVSNAYLSITLTAEHDDVSMVLLEISDGRRHYRSSYSEIAKILKDNSAEKIERKKLIEKADSITFCGKHYKKIIAATEVVFVLIFEIGFALM